MGPLGMVLKCCSECLQDVYCNWNETLCQGLDMNDCQEKCNVSQSFCGLCENNQDCIEFPSLDSNSCPSTTVCILPNGTYAFNLTETQCNSFGKCSHPCKPVCLNKKPNCFSTVETMTTCLTKGGIWESPICYFNQTTCNYTYQTCQDLTPSQCISCQSG